MSGRVYVPVGGSTTGGGISFFSAGSPGGGSETSYWLYWNENGFTGLGWRTAWDSKYCPLKAAWQSNHMNYSSDLDGFEQYVATLGAEGNLNEYLDGAPGGWDPFDKQDMIKEYGRDALEAAQCLVI